MERFGSKFSSFRKRETANGNGTPGTITTTDPAAQENQPDKPKGGNWAGNIVTPGGMRSLMVPTWYRCVTLIMETMGQMRVQYQRKDFEGGNFVEDIGVLNSGTNMRRENPNRRLNYLLQVRPNPMMTASQLQQQKEFRKIFFGNAYVYIERDNDSTEKAFWLCTAGALNPNTNTYQLAYNSDHGPVVLGDVSADDVLHFKNTIMGYDMMQGIPTINFAMKALEIAATGDQQALEDMAKGGKYKVLLQEKESSPVGTRGRANANQLKDVTRRFREDWAANDVLLLDNVADAKMLSQTAQQLQLLESRGYSAEQICQLMGVPKIMAMIGEGGSYKMPEHAQQDFMLHAIQPRIRTDEDEYNSKLLGYEDFGKRRIHVCERELRRLDATGQANIDKLHLEIGWSPNEIRSQHDLPAIEGGDAHYVSTNLAEVGSEKLRGSSPTELKPVNYSVPAGSPGGTSAQEGEEA